MIPQWINAALPDSREDYILVRTGMGLTNVPRLHLPLTRTPRDDAPSPRRSHSARPISSGRIGPLIATPPFFPTSPVNILILLRAGFGMGSPCVGMLGVG